MLKINIDANDALIKFLLVLVNQELIDARQNSVLSIYSSIETIYRSHPNGFIVVYLLPHCRCTVFLCVTVVMI